MTSTLILPNSAVLLPQLPQDLDDIHEQWRKVFEAIPVQQTVRADKHVSDTLSVYVQQFIFNRPIKQPSTQRFYIGQTTNARDRASSHLHELKKCKVTSFTAKSSIYSSKVMGGVTSVTMIYSVLDSGLTLIEAREVEKKRNELFMELYSEEEVLTRP